MRKVLREIDDVMFAFIWFLQWPVYIWNFAARAHYIPLEQRQSLFSWCIGAFGIVLMYLFTLPLGGDTTTFLSFFGPYLGSGFAAVYTGVRLSQRFKHLRPKPRFKCEATND